MIGSAARAVDRGSSGAWGKARSAVTAHSMPGTLAEKSGVGEIKADFMRFLHESEFGVNFSTEQIWINKFCW